MSVFSNNLLLGAGGQSAGGFDPTLIGNSVWLDGSADELTRATSSHSSTECVMAGWIQLQKFSGSVGMMGLGTGSTGSNNSGIWFSGGALYLYANGQAAVTTALYRDVGWYHVLASFKLDETVAADKGRVFVNGLEVTSFSADNRGTWGTSFTNTTTQSVGSISTNIFLDGYITQAIMLDGQSIQGGDVAITDFLDTFTFGTNGSEFIPKSDAAIAALATTAAGNSFCLDFSNSGSLGLDISTPANNLTSAASMDSTNQTTNTPSLVYPVWNALEASATLSNGNLNARSTTNQVAAQATQSVSSGKFYWEITANTSADQLFGITGEAVSSVDRVAVTFIATPTVFFYGVNGTIYKDGSSSSYDSAISVGDVIGIAVDFDAGKIWFAKNDTWLQSGDPANGTSPSATFTVGMFTPSWCAGGASGDRTGATDFGQLGFTHTPPTGFASLASSNLTAPDYQGIDYFKPVLYTGNGTAIGSGGKAVTGVGFQPDEVWIKNRDATDDHALYDIVRGVTKQLQSNTLTAESTEAEGLTAFGSDGFTVGSLAQVNTNAEDYVSWNWLGSNSTSTTSPAGTIASTSSAADAGHFSVGTYTGQTAAGTVGHGLGGIAEMVIVWDKGFDNSIAVYHVGVASDAATDYLLLNGTGAAVDSVLMWNDTAPTSSVFSVGTGNNTNGNTRPKSFLAFRSVPGVCKVGSYTGNSSDDGIYLSLGFKPSYWMVKCSSFSDASHDWFISDSARYTFNGTTTAGGLNGGTLEANDATAEEAHNTNFTDNPAFDFLADGIKLRTNGGAINATGRTYIYLAMADIGGNGTLPPVYGR